MNSGKYFLNILFRVLLILISCLLLVLSILKMKEEYLFSSLALGVLILIQTYLLYAYVNRISRTISHMLSSIEYNDTGVVYTRTNKSDMFNDLYTYFDNINRHLIHAKKQNEKQSLYLQSIIKHIGVGLLAFDSEEKIVLCNDAARDIFGVEYFGKLSDLENLTEGLPELIRKLKPGESQVFKLVINKEIVHLSLKLSRIKTDEGVNNLLSIQNIVSELDQNELESWQKLIKVMRHEIMNSISPVISLSTTILRYFLKDDKKTPKKIEEINDTTINKTINGLHTIEETAHHLLEFVTKYRSLTSISLPKLEELKFPDYLNNLKPLLIEIAKQKNANLEIFSDELTLKADPVQLEQLILNLFKNAIQSIDRGGKISISAVENHNGRVVIDVIDNGCGIMREELNNIFIPFYSTREDGSGIGLSIARQIMQLHRGVISVKSDPGIETIFSLKF